ncbi:hypothetical protein ACOMHN_010755 [Nucella lapillus]
MHQGYLDGTILLLVLVTATTASNTGPKLKLDKYLGRWYRGMYASTVFAVLDIWFQKGAVCVTADDGINPNGTVSILYQERVDQPTGS